MRGKTSSEGFLSSRGDVSSIMASILPPVIVLKEGEHITITTEDPRLLTSESLVSQRLSPAL